MCIGVKVLFVGYFLFPLLPSLVKWSLPDVWNVGFQLGGCYWGNTDRQHGSLRMSNMHGTSLKCLKHLWIHLEETVPRLSVWMKGRRWVARVFIYIFFKASQLRTNSYLQWQPNPDDAGPNVGHPMGLPITVSCDTAWNRTRVCSDASSTEMQ